jgi:hypothetical protein
MYAVLTYYKDYPANEIVICYGNYQSVYERQYLLQADTKGVTRYDFDNTKDVEAAVFNIMANHNFATLINDDFR